jgi:hypothetical protein
VSGRQFRLIKSGKKLEKSNAWRNVRGRKNNTPQKAEEQRGANKQEMPPHLTRQILKIVGSTRDVRRKGMRHVSAAKREKIIIIPALQSSDGESLIQRYAEFAGLMRQLLGFFSARGLVHQLDFFNSRTRGSIGEGTPYAANFERIEQSLDKLESLSSYALLVEKPVLVELEQHVAALEAKLNKRNA